MASNYQAKAMEERNVTFSPNPSGGAKAIVYISFILLLPIILFVSKRNHLIRLNEHVKQTHQSIDISLTKRFETLEVVFKATKKYLKHEKELLTSITKARAAISGPQGGDINSKQAVVSDAIGKFNLVQENYPELKASKSIAQFNTNVNEIEEELANTRRFYNSVVRKFNQSLKTFPSNVAAATVQDSSSKSGKLISYPLFEAEDYKRNNPLLDSDGKTALSWDD